MIRTRFMKIYEAVVTEGFYQVSNEGFLENDITHDEMVEILKMAKDSLGERPVT